MAAHLLLLLHKHSSNLCPPYSLLIMQQPKSAEPWRAHGELPLGHCAHALSHGRTWHKHTRQLLATVCCIRYKTRLVKSSDECFAALSPSLLHDQTLSSKLSIAIKKQVPFISTVDISTAMGWSAAVHIMVLHHHVRAHTLTHRITETWRLFFHLVEISHSHFVSLLSCDQWKEHSDLFNIYINDLTNIKTMAQFVIYADNTSLLLLETLQN